MPRPPARVESMKRNLVDLGALKTWGVGWLVGWLVGALVNWLVG